MRLPARSRLVSIFGSLALSLLSIGLFLGVAEMLARRSQQPLPARDDENHYLTDWQAWDGDFYTVKSSAVGWPPWEDYNRDGLRDREHELAKPEGVTRVVILGDSVTLGFRLRPDQAYPQVLQDMLDSEGRGVEVFNVALGGWATRQELIAYRRIARRYSPDIVLLAICLNDIPEMQNNLARPPRWLSALHQRSALVRKIVAAKEREIRSVEELFQKPGAPRVEAGFARFFADVEALRFEVAQDGAELGLVVLPFRFQVEADAPPASVQQRIVTWARDRGVGVLDLLPALRELGDAAFIDDAHLSATGTQRVAEFLLDSESLVDRGSSSSRPRPLVVAPATVSQPAEASSDPEAVLAALHRGSDEAQAAAARTLSRAEPRVIRALTDRLAHGGPEARVASAWALGRLRAGAAAGDLARALSDSDPRVRAGAAWSLGRLGGEASPALPHLVERLSDPNERVRWRAAQSLVALGPKPETRASLERVLEDPRHPSRGLAADLLGRLGSEAVPSVPLLVAALDDSREEVRGHAASALGSVASRPEIAVPALTRALAGEENRWKVVDALRAFGAAAAPAVPSLEALLEDPSGSVRWRAARALGQIGSGTGAAVAALGKATVDVQPNVRLAAMKALRRTGASPPTLLPLFERGLDDDDARVRLEAVRGLSELPASASRVKQDLERAAADADPSVRETAAVVHR